MKPPSEESFKLKLITPAIASEPYCADAPSLRTSTDLSAEAGIADKSGPCAPSEIYAPNHVSTLPLCLLLPLTKTNVWSGDIPRKLAGRITLAASLIGWSLTLNEGTKFLIRLLKSVSPLF